MNTNKTAGRVRLWARLKPLARESRGTLMVVTALLSPVLLAFMALALDIGLIYDLKRNQQKAADSAAMGAGQEIWRQNTGKVEAAGKADAKKNGFDDDDSAVTVTVEYPYSYNGGNPNDYVRVTIEEVVPTYFARAFGQTSVTVRSQAVSGLVSHADGCYYVLNESASSAFKSTGTSILRANCGVLINSDDENAAYFQNGSGEVCVPSVGIVGGYNNAPYCTDPGGPYPTVETSIPRVMDPLANFLTAPSSTGLTDYGKAKIQNGDDVDLWPGYYKEIKQTGGISRLNEGLYYVDGDFDINGGEMSSLGDGVTIYVTGRVTINGNAGTSTGGGLGTQTTRGLPATTAAASGGQTFGASSSGGGGSTTEETYALVNLHAPVVGTNGSIPGILFWGTSADTHKAVGTAQSNFKGTLYFPNGDLAFRGTNDSDSWQMIVADTAEHVGTSTSTNNFGGTFPGMPPVKKVTLLQ